MSGLVAGIYYLRDDSRGLTIVSWEHMASSSKTDSDYNFQVKFFDSGDIEFHYGDMVPPAGDSSGYHLGDFATTWLEAADGQSASFYNVNTDDNPGIQPHSAIRYKYQP